MDDFERLDELYSLFVNYVKELARRKEITFVSSTAGYMANVELQDIVNEMSDKLEYENVGDGRKSVRVNNVLPGKLRILFEALIHHVMAGLLNMGLPDGRKIVGVLSDFIVLYNVIHPLGENNSNFLASIVQIILFMHNERTMNLKDDPSTLCVYTERDIRDLWGSVFPGDRVCVRLGESFK